MGLNSGSINGELPLVALIAIARTFLIGGMGFTWWQKRCAFPAQEISPTPCFDLLRISVHW